MAVIDYIVDGHVAVVTLNSGENHFNPSFLQSFLSVLDEVESQTDATTLVVTSSHEKIFSNGIDRGWFRSFRKGMFREQKRFSIC